jgi:hypothetical protein
MNRTSFAHLRLVAVSIVATGLFVTSCKKEDDPIIPPSNPIVFTIYGFPISDGSYWIYQEERTDSDGVVIQNGAIDSVYVEGDTTIGLYTYKKIKTVVLSGSSWFPQQALRIVRDSAGYLVDVYGEYMEHDNFTDTLHFQDYGGQVHAWYFMRHRDSVVTVPAGTFETIDYEGHMYAQDPNYPWPVPRYTHHLLADGIGMILYRTYFVSSPDYIQQRLARYSIQ